MVKEWYLYWQLSVAFLFTYSQLISILIAIYDQVQLQPSAKLHGFRHLFNTRAFAQHGADIKEGTTWQKQR